MNFLDFLVSVMWVIHSLQATESARIPDPCMAVNCGQNYICQPGKIVCTGFAPCTHHICVPKDSETGPCTGVKCPNGTSCKTVKRTTCKGNNNQCTVSYSTRCQARLRPF